MLSFGNKEFRNLQEQVLKNMRDIQDIEQGATVLADFGIKIVGQVDDASELPDPATYEGEYGDGYVVGEEEPYEYYIFTRAFEGQEEPSWFNLGQFPVPGPQGETGATGAQGPSGTISFGSITTSTLNPGQNASVSATNVGSASNAVYNLAFAIPQGAQGIQGPVGPQGPQGNQGPKGDKGEKGEQGGLIEIVGIVATASDLPAPSTLQKLDAAYLVGSSPDYELYVQVGDAPSTALWTNLGAINEGTVVTVNGTPQTVWEATGQFVPISDGQLVNTLYGQAAGTGNGQTHVPYGTSATSNAIPQRDVNGQITVPETPTANGHAASKKYVDDHASSSPVEYAGDLIVGAGSPAVETRLAIGSPGQSLTVNSSGNGLEYTTINSVPSYDSSDAGNALKVNSAGTGLEWAASSAGSLTPKQLFNSDTQTSIYLPTNLINGDTVTNGSSTSKFNKDLFIGPFSTNIRAITNSTYGPTASGGSSSTVSNSIIMRCTSGSYTYFPSCEQSIIMHPNSATYSLSSNQASLQSLSCCIGSLKSYFCAGNTSGTYVTTFSADQSILFGNNNNIAKIASSSGGGYVLAYTSILMSTNTEIGVINGNTIINNSILMGIGHSIALNTATNYDGIATFGKYGIFDSNNKDVLIVGAGTSTSARANCFATGNDGTNDYIKIGDTKITETQLQALLATL